MRSVRRAAAWSGREIEVSTARGRRRFAWADPFSAKETTAADAGHIRAPMPGAIQQILASPGAKLKRGEPVLITEAMKMEHTLRDPADGTLIALSCAPGDFVKEGTDLVEFEADGSAAL